MGGANAPVKGPLARLGRVYDVAFFAGRFRSADVTLLLKLNLSV